MAVFEPANFELNLLVCFWRHCKNWDRRGAKYFVLPKRHGFVNVFFCDYAGQFDSVYIKRAHLRESLFSKVGCSGLFDFVENVRIFYANDFGFDCLSVLRHPRRCFPILKRLNSNSNNFGRAWPDGHGCWPCCFKPHHEVPRPHNFGEFCCAIMDVCNASCLPAKLRARQLNENSVVG